LEQNIKILNGKVKEMQRKVHYAEIEEKKLDKAHTEVALFVANQEKDKGMNALRQLEFMKQKLHDVNS
jgi:hypothetical protein